LLKEQRVSGVRVFRRTFTPGIPFFRPGDRSGTVARFPTYRLFILLAIPPRDYSGEPLPDLRDVVRLPAILDTGAPLSIFPFPIWNLFADRIRWLDQPPAATPRRVSILGGTFGYRLGRVKVGAIDPERRWLPPTTLAAFFLDDATGAPREVVFGLRNRLLDGRRLRHEPEPGADPEEVPGRWWLEDAA
jgi:hypothetical protein